MAHFQDLPRPWHFMLFCSKHPRLRFANCQVFLLAFLDICVTRPFLNVAIIDQVMSELGSKS